MCERRWNSMNTGYNSFVLSQGEQKKKPRTQTTHLVFVITLMGERESFLLFLAIGVWFCRCVSARERERYTAHTQMRLLNIRLDTHTSTWVCIVCVRVDACIWVSECASEHPPPSFPLLCVCVVAVVVVVVVVVVVRVSSSFFTSRRARVLRRDARSTRSDSSSKW